MTTEAEGELTLAFTVRVTGYGRPSQLLEEQRLALARALHSELGPGRFTIEDPGGACWRYDPLGDDMGNHPGHPHAFYQAPAAEGGAPDGLVRAVLELPAGQRWWLVAPEAAAVLAWLLDERAYQLAKWGEGGRYTQADVDHALEGLGNHSWFWERGVLNYAGRVRLLGVTSPLGVQALLKLVATLASVPEHLLRAGAVERLPGAGVESGELR